MAKKRKIVYQETYIKGVIGEKEEISKLINMPDTIIYIDKVGKYENDKQFITITIDNI